MPVDPRTERTLSEIEKTENLFGRIAQTRESFVSLLAGTWTRIGVFLGLLFGSALAVFIFFPETELKIKVSAIATVLGGASSFVSSAWIKSAKRKSGGEDARR